MNNNLLETFYLICSSIGLKKEGVAVFNEKFASICSFPECKMIFYENKHENQSRLWIRFANLHYKDTFMSHYFKSPKSLTLKSLGYGSESRVYIHQNLSKLRYQAFKHAIQLKKNGLVTAVRTTAFGEVSVKVNGQSRFETVKTISDVNALMRPSTTKSQSIFDTPNVSNTISDDENL